MSKKNLLEGFDIPSFYTILLLQSFAFALKFLALTL